MAKNRGITRLFDDGRPTSDGVAASPRAPVENAGKLSSSLLALFDLASTNGQIALNNVTGPSQTVSDSSWVTVDLFVAEGMTAPLLADLQAAGLRSIAHVDSLVSGVVRLGDVGKLAALNEVASVRYSPFQAGAGSVDSGADEAIHTGPFQAKGYTGAGVTIGVLSDSYNWLNGAAADILSGDLPAVGVGVIQDFLFAGSSDEGRAMLQIVHDIAPGSSLLFATAFTGMAGFANNIRALAAAGADVIVDDVGYLNGLTFTEDLIGEATTEVSEQGVAYFTSAGNSAREGFIESAPVFDATTGYLDFNEATAGLDAISFTPAYSGSIAFRLTWADRAPSAHAGLVATTDLDFYLTGTDNIIVAGSDDAQGAPGVDPLEVLQFNVTAGTTYRLWVHKFAGSAPSHVQITQWGGPPGMIDSSGVDEWSSVFGHPLAAGAFGVGAVYYRDTPAYGGFGEVESFSSYGRGFATHDQHGNAVAPTVRHGAEIAGVDGLNTTFFGSDSDGDGHPNFFGTSAAAPSVAAVAALLLQQNPNLTPAQLLALIQSTADTAVSYFEDADFDLASGAGLVNARSALEAGFHGTPQSDTIRGVGAADVIYGYASNDNLSGGDGDDWLYGGPGADVLDGGQGNDSARYEDATSGVTVALFAPELNAGAAAGDTYIGIENIVLSGLVDTGYGSNGNNTIMGLGGNDSLYGQGGNDAVHGDAGNDLLWGGLGADFLDGGDGFDYVRYDDATFPSLTAALFAPGLNTGAAAGDTYGNVEGLILGFFDDKGYGSNDADYIYGINGNDQLYGQGGNDNVFGGIGNDLLWGGLGADFLDGGDGFDYARYDDATFPSLVASLSSPGINTGAAAGDTYANLEGLILGFFDDTGYGAGSADYLYGINGNDTLYGLGGNDNLYGGAGNDTIVGGEGNDTLSGDIGSDAFRFDVAPNFAINADVILDFALGDKIHLENGVFTALVATGVLGANNFRNGAGVTTAADADDFIIYNNSTGDLYYDLDGSGAGSAVKFATLSNMANLTWSDIIVT